MSIVKIEEVKSAKRSGGRPPSEGWILYDFTKVEGDKGKSLAKCGKCLSVLKNTSLSRMANHRKRCGVQGYSASGEKINQQKLEVDVVEQEEQAVDTIMWTSPGTNLEKYVDESVPIEKVNQTAMEILDEDIKRHRKSVKAKGRSDFSALDASLSSFLIGCNLTFDIVDSPLFKKFVSSLNHNYVVPSSTQLKARVLSQLKTLESPEKHRPKKRRYYESSDSDSD